MKSAMFIAIFLISASVFAQGVSTGGTFLKLIFPARVMGMGESTVADASNRTASYMNPASLASGNGSEVMFSQIQWIQDTQTQLVSTSIPLSFGTIAFAISSTGVSGIEIHDDNPGPAIGIFSSHSSILQVGYATTIVPEASIGVTIKYLYEKLYIDEATGFALDVGGLYRTPVNGLTVGLSLTNAGKMDKFRTENSDIPTNVHVGGNYECPIDDFDFTAAFAISRETVIAASSIHLGAEAVYNKIIAVRLGYQTGYEIRGVSVGLGLHYSIGKFDYAYVPFSQGFGNAHILTVSLEF